MTIPSERRIELPLLKVIEEAGGRLRMLEAVDKVARFFPDLRSDDMQKRRPSGQLAFRNNVQWARQRLVRKGELDKSVRGVWIITDLGRTRLEHEWDNWKPTGLGVTPTTSTSLKLTVQRSLKEGLVDDESKLWDLVRDWVDKYWGEEARRDGDEYWVKNTAQKTRSARPGKWSRPDVTAVQVSRFTVLPHRSLEITTFEIKRFEDAKEVTSVYEAAAHQRWAHLSYLVAEVPNLDSVLREEVLSEARRFGVGVLLSARSKETNELEIREVLNPQRQDPSPKSVDNFLKDVFAGEEKELQRLKDSLR